MCNQFRLPNLAQIKQYLREELNLPLVDPSSDYKAKDIFPNQTAPVLLYQNNQLQLVNKNWGYPSPVDANKPLFNARIERFYEQKPSMWDESFAKQRCIILSSKFFEYAKKTYQAGNGKRYHERYSFKANHPITMIAGIYDKNNFAMVTTNPNRDIAPIHNRMPLVIEPSELRRWLFQNFTSLINRDSINLSVTKQPNKK